ncbi:MAG: trimethylamine methyltransferase [Spirochaetes bacterium]|nr:MAG: trimethylamine methyltransferase [Spirochaetota bacterium]
MREDFLMRYHPKITILGEEEKLEIHRWSLRVLEKTGIIVYEDEALGLLRDAGCKVDSNRRVKIPEHIVEEAIRTVPQKIEIYNRSGKTAMVLEDRKGYFGTGSDTPNVIDHESGKRRKAVIGDVNDAARVADALDNINFIMSMGLAADVPAKRSDRYHFAAMVRNTTKPIMFTAWDLQGLKDIYQMAAAVAGGEKNLQEKPFVIHYAMNTAPLIHPKESLQKVLFCAEKGIPVEYHSVDIGGSTAPATLAGAFIQGNARNLSSMVIHQLKAPGAPLIIHNSVAFLNMSTMVEPYFSPEVWLSSLMNKEMALSYGIPTFAKAGAGDAKMLDQQAGIEIGLSVYHEYLTGNNLIHDMGYLESGMTASLESLVISDEVAGIVKRICRGMDFSPEHAALDVIEKVGPDGQFLDQEHTLKHFREEFWFPKLMDQNNYYVWQEKGCKSLLDRARLRVEEILRTHASPPLESSVEERIEEILLL